jgi:hypothetical protein
VFDVAVVGFAHPSDDIITTDTELPSCSAELWYVLLFVPTLLPFNFH